MGLDGQTRDEADRKSLPLTSPSCPGNHPFDFWSILMEVSSTFLEEKLQKLERNFAENLTENLIET